MLKQLCFGVFDHFEGEIALNAQIEVVLSLDLNVCFSSGSFAGSIPEQRFGLTEDRNFFKVKNFLKSESDKL